MRGADAGRHVRRLLFPRQLRASARRCLIVGGGGCQLLAWFRRAAWRVTVCATAVSSASNEGLATQAPHLEWFVSKASQTKVEPCVPTSIRCVLPTSTPTPCAC